MNKYTVELKTGMSYAKPSINKFSSGFDTLEFLLEDDSMFSDCTFAVVYSVCDKTAMDVENGGKLIKTADEAGSIITLTWTLGTEVSFDSGIVIYQVVAYRTSGDGAVEAVWYSPQGRIVVGDSVDTTEYETMQLGAQPSLVAQLIAAVTDANKDAGEALGNSRANSAEILNIKTETAQMSDRILQAESDIREIANSSDQGLESLNKQASQLSDAVELLNTKAASAEGSIADIYTGLDSKVDKVYGMGLSQQSFTSDEKSRLEYLSRFFKKIPDGKTVDDLNSIDDVGYYTAGTEDAPYLLAVMLYWDWNYADSVDKCTVCQIAFSPSDACWYGTDISLFRHIDTNNDSNWTAWTKTFASADDVREVKSALETKVAKEPGKGLSEENYTSEDRALLYGFENQISNKVDKEDGKQLSTEDYTTKEKQKLSLLPSNFKELPADTNLDDVKEPGCYIGYEYANYNSMDYMMPYMLLVAHHNYYDEATSSEYQNICQTRIYCNATDENAAGIIQRRICNFNSWSAWKTVYATREYVDEEIAKIEVSGGVSQQYVDSAIQAAILDSWEAAV